MNHRIALSFEDGVTRFVDCRAGDTLADAAYRAGINIPLDCRDGACGTCKAYCEAGRYDGGSYIDEAMSAGEAAAGYVLACQMRPQSDCVVRIAASAALCRTTAATHRGRIGSVTRLSGTAVAFSIELDAPAALGFLPGQYVNVRVPGTDQKRAYSFSCGPGRASVSFLLRDTAAGLLPAYLRERAEAGAAIEFEGPLGSFYLREIRRPVLMLAGGTGLAPFLAMLEQIAETGTDYPVHLIYGVTGDADLVELDRLDAAARRIADFTYVCCVADPASPHPNRGYVTHHLAADKLHDGDVDVYLCGPPPMVDAVRAHFAAHGIRPANFHYEKFVTSGLVTAIGDSIATATAAIPETVLPQ
ncbi:MAG TPA: benzoate 1,2-dioxygenase electron transfer component BenC [Plasticicumulans sp.]|uniref:benzoate 1,2-dioxygenase electron transfer component BenC n=1 Tax=Plasticicumulans sp. TaxID=2307179 RepID=UPI002C9E9887|nr:benzoate 1,2-dioxygenase electron transfer component BenC [Plasticicumulans sp.]HMV38439.1 benzoate 1,2-dioxygenase electron transfer component BenC [Plasticicumulans sp.]HMW29043.1 benzoate 1,2-dioxygenase electron transfer component BenC [Plasticicumulans sp.]HMW42153.1 benzoate 1,2-dioxygenase electron transfer component BenC [Plasticicumulans sp.]HMZ10479.1 benzoate 1,2-dioxygenase electron transfer component BenC [Plasticicumulans sp.]HND98759.1 benzoate 1,2-dioxygenase electron transf